MKALKERKVYQSRGKSTHFSFGHGKDIRGIFKINLESQGTTPPWEQRVFHTEVGKGLSTQREVYAHNHSWVHNGWMVRPETSSPVLSVMDSE